MGVNFMSDLKRVCQENLRCLYCERSFEAKWELNAHYLSAHEDAFSAEELKMATSPLPSDPKPGLTE